MDPARGGNLLRFINDYVGMPGAVPCSCMMVEVMDRATLRPHIFFFAAADVPAGEELLLDYGDVSVLACPSLRACFRILSLGCPARYPRCHPGGVALLAGQGCCISRVCLRYRECLRAGL